MHFCSVQCLAGFQTTYEELKLFVPIRLTREAFDGFQTTYEELKLWARTMRPSLVGFASRLPMRN